MRVGSVVYATFQGLGILAKSFYDNGIVTDVFVIEHSRHPTHWDWYPPETPQCPIRPLNVDALRNFCSQMDVVLFFETPFEWSLVNYCQQLGIKTIMMPMYECSLQHPPAQFDEYWCPSLLDLQYFSQGSVDTSVSEFSACQGVGNSIARFTPVPVKVQWKQRHTATVFVHNAGHGGLKGRNGTKELLEAMQYVRSPIKLILRSQEATWTVNDMRIKRHFGTQPYETLYSEGDVFIFPEKFNGLSLPLQEARAAGMLVMATNRYPINTWLATESLIETSISVRNRIGPPYIEFDEAVIDPLLIADKIDEWYNQDIHEYSLQGKSWAESMSWGKLGPKYLELLRGL